MANYGEGGFLARMAELVRSSSPRASLDLPSPFEWGDPTAVRTRFANFASSIQTHDRRLAFAFDSLEEALEFWERTNAPVIALKNMLPADAYSAMRSRLSDLMRDLSVVHDGHRVLDSDYLLAVARKSAGAE